MHEKLDEKISVALVYNHKSGVVLPWKLKWAGQDYTIDKVGFHHTLWEGKSLHHIFSVTSNQTFFRLNLDTTNLHWTVEEVADGNN